MRRGAQLTLTAAPQCVYPYSTMKRLYLCQGPSCSARGAIKIRHALTAALWEAGLLDAVELHASGCQDHCDYGPNLLIQPEACRYAGLTTERVVAIVGEHLRDGRPIETWQATPEMRRGAS